jgi:hypothetical protein
MEDRMSQQIEVADENERLIALQAIETYRALRQAMKTAPHGRGLATLEAVVHDKGFEHLKQMMQQVSSEHPEAQKKGAAV